MSVQTLRRPGADDAPIDAVRRELKTPSNGHNSAAMGVQPMPRAPPSIVYEDVDDGDILIGGRAITAFVNQVTGGNFDKQTVFTWLAKGKLPSGKFGAKCIGSKRAIRRALAQAAAGLTTP